MVYSDFCVDLSHFVSGNAVSQSYQESLFYHWFDICSWICYSVQKNHWNGYKSMYSGSLFRSSCESFTVYLLVKIKNEISGYDYFCKLNGINRVYDLFDIPQPGRTV